MLHYVDTDIFKLFSKAGIVDNKQFELNNFDIVDKIKNEVTGRFKIKKKTSFKLKL